MELLSLKIGRMRTTKKNINNLCRFTTQQDAQLAKTEGESEKGTWEEKVAVLILI